MKRFTPYATAVAMMCACLAATLVAKPTFAAGDPALQADHAWVVAMEKGDTAAINKLTDADFTWIDTDGIM